MVRIAAILLFLVAVSTMAHDAQPNRTAFDYVCTELSVNCEGINPPDIVITEIMGEFGLWGAYMPGENRLYIDPDAPPETMVHEMVHYILYEINAGFGKCFGEELARVVHHRWANTPYDDSWRQRYRC